MSQSQNVEVKLKFVVDDSGAKVIDQMTGATKQAAKAEEEYQKKLNARIQSMKEQERMAADLRRMGVLSGPAAPPTIDQLATSAADRIRQQQAVHAELVRRGVVEGPKPVAPPPTVAEEAHQRIQAAIRRRQVAEEMARLGYGSDDKPDVDRSTRAQRLHARGMKALGSVARVGGGVTAGVYAGEQLASLYLERSKIDANAWTSESQKETAKRRAMPLFLGRAYGLGLDIGKVRSGDNKRIAQAERDRILSGPEVQRATGTADISGDLEMEDWFARYQAGEKMKMFHTRFNESAITTLRRGPKHGPDQSFQLAPLRLDRPQGFDRSTVLGEKLYKEEEQLLPLRQNLTRATRRHAEAETLAAVESNKAAELNQQAQRLRKEYLSSKGIREELGKGKNEAAETAQIQAYAKEDPQAQRVLTALEQARDQQMRALQARRNSAQTEHEKRQADIEIKRGQYEVAKQREQTTYSQAQRAGSLSPVQYQMAIQAFRQVKQVGLSRATPEMIQAAKQIAPETIAKMERDIGEKRLPELQKEVGSEEYRNKSLAEARKRTDEAREQVTQSQDADAQKTSEGMAKAVSGVMEVVMKLFDQKMDALKSQFEGQMSHATMNQNQ
jgi:hypothetical protein